MKDSKIKNMTFIALVAALLCVTGPLVINLPISPVPISVANLIIYICTIVVGYKRGTIAVILYLLIGMIGLPVFSNFTGGAAKLIGPTGGYLIGFIFIALITGIFVQKFKGKIYMYALGMVLATLVCYAVGTAWLAFSAKMEFQKALFAGVIPFIPGDIVKIIIALLVGEKIRLGVEKSK